MGFFKNAAEKIDEWWHGPKTESPYPGIAVWKSMLAPNSNNRSAIDAIAAIGGAKAVDALVEKIGELCWDRNYLVNAIGRIEHEASFHALMKILHHADQQVVDEAVRAIIKKGETAAPLLLEKFRAGEGKEKYNAAYFLRILKKDEGIRFFIGMLDEPEHRYQAALNLSLVRRPDMIPFLIIAAAKEKNQKNRCHIYQGIRDCAAGDTDPKEIRGAVLALLKGTPGNQEKRRMAAGYLIAVKAIGKHREKLSLPEVPKLPLQSRMFRNRICAETDASRHLRRRAMV